MEAAVPYNLYFIRLSIYPQYYHTEAISSKGNKMFIWLNKPSNAVASQPFTILRSYFQMLVAAHDPSKV